MTKKWAQDELDIFDLFTSTDFDLVQIAYQLELSVSKVRQTIKQAKKYFRVRTDKELVEKLNEEFS